MSRRNAVLLGLILVIVFIEVLVFMPKDLDLSPGDSNDSKIRKDLSANPSGQVMHDVHLTEAKPSGKEWELWAKKAVKPRDGGEWNIEKVRVRFFGSNGVEYVVTGNTGRVETTTNDIQITGKVETRSSNGYIFKSERLFYDSKSRKLKSPDQVEMLGFSIQKSVEMKLTGEDLLADLSTNRIYINKNVAARKQVRPGKFLTIGSGKAVFSGQDRTAEFNGAVNMEVDSMKLSGPEAKFKYRADGVELESVEAVGGVKMTDANKFASGQKVVVNFVENSVLFTGKPRVMQNGDELVGDQIILLDGGKRIKVQNVKANMDTESTKPQHMNPQ